MKRKILLLSPRCFVRLVCVAFGCGALGQTTHSFAETPPERFLIEAAQLTAAMREGRLPVDGVRLQLAAPVTASSSAARIKVTSTSPVGEHQIRVRFVCSDPGECLPFLATVTYPDGVDVGRVQMARTAKAPTDRQAGLQIPVAAGVTASAKSVAIKDSEVLRAGSTAMLEFEGSRIHVRIEVISLQSGVAGSRIRVSSIDHKQIYTAEVITPTLVRGELAQ